MSWNWLRIQTAMDGEGFFTAEERLQAERIADDERKKTTPFTDVKADETRVPTGDNKPSPPVDHRDSFWEWSDE